MTKSKSVAIVFLLTSLTLLLTLHLPNDVSLAAADSTVRYVAPGGNCGGASP